MLRAPVFVIALVTLFASCQSSDAPEVDTTGSDSTTIRVIRGDVPDRTVLISNIEYLRLRAQPGSQGEIVENLGRGSELYYLGEMTSFRTQVTLRGITFNEPWVKVETEDGIEGWIFAGAVNFRLDGSSSLPEHLIEMRLESLFGSSLSDKMKTYRNAFHDASNAEELRDAYRLATSIREGAVERMEQSIRVSNTDQLPDLFWLEEALPALQPQLVAEGTQYYLFHQYNDWAQRARRTTGVADDAYFALSQEVYAIDSIEYFFPSYFLQTWDYGGHSELGSSKHRTLLDRMNRTMDQAPAFSDEILIYKKELLDDILNPENSYWNDQAMILEELDLIIANPPAILTDDEQIALGQRRKQFSDPVAYSIQLNARAGLN